MYLKYMKSNSKREGGNGVKILCKTCITLKILEVLIQAIM